MTSTIHRYLTALRLVLPALMSASVLALTACSDSSPATTQELPDQPVAVAEAVPQPPFADVTVSSGLRFKHAPFLTGHYFMPEIMGAGTGLFDYDQDGDLDVYLIQGAPLTAEAGDGATDQLFKNMWIETGQLEFINVTAGSGIEAAGYGMGIAIGDYDSDGQDDLFVTNYGANQLWRNHGDGHFENVTEAAGIQGDDWSSSAAFVDIDNDGDLDLYVANYVAFSTDQNYRCTSESGKQDYCGPDTYKPVPDQLFENLGNGTFRESSAMRGLNKAYGPGLGLAVSDFDSNGGEDIYVANDGASNQLWMNDGRGHFQDNGLMSGTSLNADGVAEAGMGVMAGDFDNDGDDDLFMTHLIAETNTLYLNNGQGQFYDATNQVNLAADSLAMTGFGAGWLDYNNDTYLDLFVANGNVKLEATRAGKSDYPFEQVNQLFRNMFAVSGRYEFIEVSHQAPDVFDVLEVSRGAAFGDLNNDGAVDILLTNNNGPARVLLNQSDPGVWYGIHLAHPEHLSREGAVVSLLATNELMHRRVVRRSGSYLSSHDHRIRLINPSQNVSGELTVEVQWPDGLTERWSDLTAGSYHHLMRGQGRAVESQAGALGD